MRKSRYVAAGDKDFAAGRYERAELEYRAALRLPPPDPHALGNLGLLYHAQGRWVEALACLDQALKLQPGRLELRAKLGRSLLVMQQFKAARDQAHALLAQAPENAEGLLLLTASITSTQDLALAEQAFVSVSAAGKNQAGYHLARGALFLHKGDLSAAESEYRQELALYPKSSEAHQAFGALLMQKQDFDQAGAALKLAAELAPIRSGARLAYADWKLRTGKTTEAIQDVEDLLKQAPDFLPGWLFDARVAAAQGKADKAAASIAKVLARDAFNLEGLSMQGSLLLAQGDGTKAAAFFERIIKAYPPGPAPAHYNLAAAYVMSGDHAKAIRSLNRALELQTNYTDAVLLLSEIQVRQGHPAAALPALRRVVQQQPQLQQAHFALAGAYLAQKSLDEAAGVYRRMLALFTNNAEVPFRLGTVLLLQSKTNEARLAFEKSLAVAPDLLSAVEQLVLLDLAENRGADASDRVGQLIEKYPKLPLLYVLQARICLARAGVALAKEKHEGVSSRLDFTMSSQPAVREDVDRAEAALLKAIELNRDYFPAHQLLATLYLNSNRAQQAADRLTQVLARTNDLTCMLELAALQEHLKAYPAARSTYEKLLTFQPQCIPAINSLALLLTEQLGDTQRAFDLLQQAREVQPNNPYVADTLGWILYRRHDYRASLNLFHEAAKQLSGEEIQCHLGLARYMLGEEALAQTALSDSLKSSKNFTGRLEGELALQIIAIDPAKAEPAARALLTERSKSSPDDSLALERLAATQSRNGQFPDALAGYQRALKINPKNPRVLYGIAQLYADHFNQPNDAFQAAKSAHTADPENPRISALLGRLAYQTGDFEWASNLLQDSSRKLPDELQISFDLAWSYYSIGNVPQAIAAMRRIAQRERFPQIQDAMQFVNMTSPAENASAAGERLAAAEKILDTDPAYVPALIVSAAAAEQRGDFPNAARLYRRALARFPLFVPAARRLALVAFEHLKDDATAYEFATKAIKTSPDDPQLARALAILSYRRGDYSRCAQLLSPLSSGGKDGELLSYLGLAQYQLKQTALCKATLQQAVASALPDSLAADVKRALADLK
jgi:tetratricopeptide (TPR) repeat protein